MKQPLKPLPKRQQQFYDIFCDKSLWRPPTQQTITEKMHIKSTRMGIYYLKALKRKGYIGRKGQNYYPVTK